MKFVSFNVNSIRARMHQLSAVIEKYQPDVIGLQETKVVDQEFPVEEIKALGYHSQFHGQKTHYGVALLTKQAPLWSEKGFATDSDEAQRRFVACAVPDEEHGEVIVFNGYFPQGESRDHPVKFPAKERYYHDITERLKQLDVNKQAVVVMGDMNVALEDSDIGIGADNAKRWLRSGKTSFLPEERLWLQTLISPGLVDTYRACYPSETQTEESAQYSWFDYRSRGFEREPKRGLRIDFIFASPVLVAGEVQAGIDYEIRGMEKPSDHCPIWFES